jgi:hypothetical protein
VDVSIHAVVVHQLLAYPILGHPLAKELVSGLWILNQPIDYPLKVLVLGQVDSFHQCGLHLLLQHMRVVCGNKYAMSMLEGAGVGHANSVGQTNMFLHGKEN